MAVPEQDNSLVGASVLDCRYCGAPLRPKAIYCTECEKFQTVGSQVLNSLSVSTVTTVLPLLALVAAFLNQTLIIPYSKVRAVPIACRTDSVLVGLSNTGTRPAIVGGGTLRVTADPPPDIERDVLGPNGDALVLEPQKTALVKYSITHYRGEDLQALPDLSARRTCRYDLRLTVMEFGEGERPPMDLTCGCPN
jgi:hypothetical protein